MSNVSDALNFVRNQRAQTITLRRGESTLPGQSFRLERLSRAGLIRGEASQERRADAVLLGAANADIAIDDRFNADGCLWRVNFIQPNRQYATIAEVQVVQ